LRFLDIQILRAIAILSIVFGHSLAIHTSAWSFIYKIQPFIPFKIIGFLFSSYFLWLFVIMSGFLYASQTEKKIVNFKYFVINKFKRLLIPYFVWGVIYFLIFNNISNYSILELMLQLSKGIGHLWFLLMLFWVFVLAFFITKLKLPLSSDIIAISLLFLMGILMLSNNWNILQLSNSFKYLFGFYFGIILFKNQSKIELIHPRMITKLILLFFGIFFIKFGGEYIIRYLLKIDNRFIFEIYKEIIGLPLGILGSFIIYVVVKNNINLLNRQTIKLLDIIEKNSFGIYILHQFIMFLFLMYFQVHISSIVLPLILVVLGLVGSIFGCILIKKVNWLNKII
jgi:fucose 4-O-acetylase-like acetyltransferase